LDSIFDISSSSYFRTTLHFHPSQNQTLPTTHFTSTAIAFLTLSSGAMSWKMRAFSGKDCTGSAQEVNVWDNTCRDQNIPATQSFRALNYGALLQRADFYDIGGCAWSPRKTVRADGHATSQFKVGECYTLGFNARAFGSRSG
jgi:hypothetical protein